LTPSRSFAQIEYKERKDEVLVIVIITNYYRFPNLLTATMENSFIISAETFIKRMLKKYCSSAYCSVPIYLPESRKMKFLALMGDAFLK